MLFGQSAFCCLLPLRLHSNGCVGGLLKKKDSEKFATSEKLITFAHAFAHAFGEMLIC